MVEVERSRDREVETLIEVKAVETGTHGPNCRT